jgi:hypothetical protein
MFGRCEGARHVFFFLNVHQGAAAIYPAVWWWWGSPITIVTLVLLDPSIIHAIKGLHPSCVICDSLLSIPPSYYFFFSIVREDDINVNKCDTLASWQRFI